jgi:glycosyltransferase involved in cell wall biosynthesis
MNDDGTNHGNRDSRGEPFLSVVVPAFNQEGTIVGNIRVIAAELGLLPCTWEIVIVSDGSTDGTLDELLAIRDRRVRVLGYTANKGKGNALKVGSEAARGRYVAWLDGDLDLSPASIAQMLEAIRRSGANAVIGSKRHPASEVDYPLRRRLYSRAYQWLVQLLFGLHVRDTQVGLKVFEGRVLKGVLPLVLVKRYAFDLEVLVVARHLGFRQIEEHPVRLTYRFSGSGVNTRAVMLALVDTCAIFYRLRIRRSYDRPPKEGAARSPSAAGQEADPQTRDRA